MLAASPIHKPTAIRVAAHPTRRALTAGTSTCPHEGAAVGLHGTSPSSTPRRSDYGRGICDCERRQLRVQKT